MTTNIYPAIITPPSGLKIPKKVGQTIGASVKFFHKGKGGTAYVSWGIAPGSGAPWAYNANLMRWVLENRAVSLKDDASFEPYTVSLSGAFPSIDPVQDVSLLGIGYYGAFDCYLVVGYEGKVYLPTWFDDVYVRTDFFEPGVEAEFKELTATFS